MHNVLELGEKEHFKIGGFPHSHINKQSNNVTQTIMMYKNCIKYGLLISGIDHQYPMEFERFVQIFEGNFIISEIVWQDLTHNFKNPGVLEPIN